MAITVISSLERPLSGDDRQLLFEIMRIAYATTETEIWGENYVRMSFEEYNALIDKGVILVAYLEEEIAGCIHFYPSKETSYGFSLLATRLGFTGKGVGRALIEESERRAKANGAQYMDIEILRPRDFDVPVKLTLKTWYESLGYYYTYSENFANRRPEKAKKLVVPSNFDCYRKEL